MMIKFIKSKKSKNTLNGELLYSDNPVELPWLRCFINDKIIWYYNESLFNDNIVDLEISNNLEMAYKYYKREEKLKRILNK